MTGFKNQFIYKKNMKFNLLFLILIFTEILPAQTFTELPSTPPFGDVSEGSIAFSDVNADQINDVIITGLRDFRPISKLYINDGIGNFTEVIGTPFTGVAESSVAFSDVNGDGIEDLLITGRTIGFQRISKLYINNGNGNFTETMGTPFVGVSGGSIAFSDINGDGSNDVLITGENNSNDRITKLYTNDGLGNFTEANTSFDGLAESSIVFSDINGNGIEDLLLTGRKSTGQSVTKLYTNNGNGIFSEVINTSLEPVRFSSIAFSDVNGDGNNDVLITGLNSSSEPISKLYTNDGNNNFTEILDTPFLGVRSSSVAFSDINGDGTKDVLITGRNPFGGPSSKLYTNDGLGNFTEVIPTPFEQVTESSIAFSDVNGDGDHDVLITGLTSSNEPISKLYINDGIGNFTEMMGIPFERVKASSIAFSDVNNDGNNDVLITGNNTFIEQISKLYTNDGMGNFTEVIDTPFDGIQAGSMAFSDINGDGIEDVLITGKNQSFADISKLYINDGMGNFMEVIGTPFDGVRSSSVAFSDVNNDGNNDVFITGENSSDELISKLYINDGTGNFTEIIDTPFEGVSAGSIAFSDVNGDGADDLLITGRKSSDERISKLYINDGTGNFTEMIDTPFDGVWFGSVAFADVNSDGTNDLFITGENNSSPNIAKLYTNDGNGNFTEVINTPFDGVWGGSIAFSDVNGDGSYDLLITGENNSDVEISKLYINDGMGNFTEVIDTPFIGVAQSSIAFSDINGDGREDLLITGKTSTNNLISKLYINNWIVSTDDLKIELSLDFNLFPNPTSSSMVSIHYTGTEIDLAIINLYSINGGLLKQQSEFSVIEGQNIFPINITTLSKGAYFIELQIGEKKGIANFIVQ